MNYQKIWNKVLDDDEEVKYEFTIGTGYRVLGIIVLSLLGFSVIGDNGEDAILGGLMFILIGLFYFGFYLKAANAYAFTNKRILIHKGWLSTKLNSIDYPQITDVYIKEPFIKRLLTGTGSFIVSTAGTHRKEVTLKNVASPYEIKKELDRITNKHGLTS